MKSRTQRNLEIYNAPEVTSYYAGLTYLSPCERLLFETCIPPNAQLLDLGVGGGRTTAFLSRTAARYVGVDNSPGMIESCRKKFPHLEFVVADAADLSGFDDASFDIVVFAFNGIDFVQPDTNRHRCLTHIHRVLRPEGLVIFSSHNARAILVRPSWSRERILRMAQKVSGGSRLVFNLAAALLKASRVCVAYFQALLATVARCVRRLPRKMFWCGEGQLLDRAHGGLLTHYSVPRRVMSEAAAAHLTLVRVVGDDYPKRSHALASDWYYYVFKKPIGK
jgi:SAM-dependent methyltransferase